MSTIRRDSTLANGVVPSTGPMSCPSASCWAGSLVLTALCRALDQRSAPAPVAGQERGSDRKKRP
eukprot:11599417-Heterocapsa_arctica.AAC.1